MKGELKPKKYINYNNETETIECDNVMKSEDIEDATFMYEDPSKLKVVADNIRMKSPYKIYMNWVKINLRRRLTLFRFVLCFLRSSWAGQVFSSTSKTEKKKKKKKKGKKRTSVITNLFQESILIITLIKHIREIHFCVLDVTELLRR